MRTTIALVVISLAGCGNKSDAPAGDKKVGEGDPAPAKLAYKKLGTLPLEAEVPDGANIDDTTKGVGYPSATVYASPTTFINGAGDMSDQKPTIEATKEHLVKQEKSLK